ncbi:MAG: DEAD/DEAH box helicase, partial [Novosphingobium sp.]|nr:DEAD/DEAH box helicase [Novosphingobium sp.]
MRPQRLNPLFIEVSALDGVGPRLMRPLERLSIKRVKDLVYNLPDRFVERRAVGSLAEAAPGENIVIALTPVEYRASSGRGPFRVLGKDRAGNICALTYFGRASHSARRLLPLGETRWIAGRLDQYGQMLQIVHPDHVATGEQAGLGHLREPVYALSEGLTQTRIASLVARALPLLPDLPEWIEPGLLERRKWPAWREALALAHKCADTKSRDRLAYDELLANSLALMLVRQSNRARSGTPLRGDGRLRKRLSLPFALTAAQRRAIAEIESDIAQSSPMLRLLQGDVGSGKTVVALHAMLAAVEAGAQAALLAPTEILARQHHATLMRLAQGIGVEIALLTGRDKGRARESILMGLVDGSIDMVVGTHAL